MYGMDIIKYKGQTIIQIYNEDNDLVDEAHLDFVRPKTLIDSLVLAGIVKSFKKKYSITEVNTFRLER